MMGTEPLYANDELHEVLLASAGESICVVDAAGVFHFVNAAAAAMLGGRPEEFVGRSNHDIFPAEIADRQVARLREVIATGRGTVVEEHLPLFRGASRWLHTSIQPLHGPDGRIGAALVVARDVTGRKTAQIALQAAHDRLTTLETIVDFGPAVAFRCRLAEDVPVEFVSRNIRQFGYTPEDFTSGRVSWSGIIHDEDLPRVRREVERFLAEGSSTFGHHYRIHVADGSVRWVEDRNRFLTNADGRVTHIDGVIWDITDRRHTEREMLRYQERLRSLAQELSMAEERERKRLAVALHDDVCQILSATKWKLARLKGLDDIAARERWGAEVAALLDRAIHSTRSLTTQLSHPALYEAGLAAAVEWLAGDIASIHGLRVDLEMPRERDPLDPRARAVLFQCLRELLVNVSKHAGAAQARVRMAWDNGQLRLEVADAGRGFDPQAVHAKVDEGGFGLFSIRERVEMFGGRMDLRSAPGEGTTVALEMPFDNATTA